MAGKDAKRGHARRLLLLVSSLTLSRHEVLVLCDGFVFALPAQTHAGSTCWLGSVALDFPRVIRESQG